MPGYMYILLISARGIAFEPRTVLQITTQPLPANAQGPAGANGRAGQCFTPRCKMRTRLSGQMVLMHAEERALQHNALHVESCAEQLRYVQHQQQQHSAVAVAAAVTMPTKRFNK